MSSDQQWEDANSRLIAAIDKVSLRKLQRSSVLLVGMNGLGVETAKDLILMGIQHLMLYDHGVVTYMDLASNFFVDETKIGVNKVEAVFDSLKELNELVDIEIVNDLSENVIKGADVVVSCLNVDLEEMIRMDLLCRQAGKVFICCDSWGLFGYVFTDFGESFEVNDRTGEPIKSGYIASISHDVNAVVTMVEGQKHDLSDGDTVKITQLDGLSELNNREYLISVIGPFQFSINVDTSEMSQYAKGGKFEEIKKPKNYSYNSLESFVDKPVDWYKISLVDDSKFFNVGSYHIFIQAMLKFQKDLGRKPSPYNEDEYVIMRSILNDLNESLGEEKYELVDEILKRLTFTSFGELCPVSAFLGGFVSQQVISAVSGKFSPLDQWLYFESTESLPEELTTDVVLNGTRYDGQIAVFGNQFQEVIKKLNYFVVGVGAIGCEILKNFAMMGIGAGTNGKITATDLDTIEISNLNRQFLFRKWHVSELKSEVAAQRVREMNPDMNIQALSVKVGKETENYFNDEFWLSLDGICNALDNLQARLYVDSQCVTYKKPLVDSGTMGTKGHVQVVVPFLTQSYGATADPPDTHVPLCTLHNFPNKIEHCLQWGRETLFEKYFIEHPKIVNQYLEDANYFNNINPALKGVTANILKESLLEQPTTFDECIIWARSKFDEYFNYNLNQLLFNYPHDYIDEGAPFWSGTKVPPIPFDYDPSNILHADFIVSASFLRAYTMGIIDSEFKQEDYELKRQDILDRSRQIETPPFVPKEGIKIETDESKTDAPEVTLNQNDILASLEELPRDVTSIRPVVFEKDDDTNFHIDFIYSGSNIRAENYQMESVDRLQSKIIAGKIIPAMITTTAIVAGLSCLEILKQQSPWKRNIEDYCNSYCNIALPVFQSADPTKPSLKKFLSKRFSEWDFLTVKLGKDISLKNFIIYFKKKYGIEVQTILSGSASIFMSFLPNQENLNKPLSQLISEVTDQEIYPGKKFFLLDISAQRKGKDIPSIPRVCYYFTN